MAEFYRIIKKENTERDNLWLEQQLCFLFQNRPYFFWRRESDSILLQIEDRYPCDKQLIEELSGWLHPEGFLVIKEEHSNASTKLESARIEEKTLPLLDNSPITLLQTHALLLHIPLPEEVITRWFHCNFINITYRKYFFFDYTDYQSFYQPLFECTSLPYLDLVKANRKEVFLEALYQDHYIFVWIDKYFLSSASCFHRYHDVHPALLYGYNERDGYYNALLFEIKKGTYRAKIPYEEIHHGFESAKIYSLLLPQYDGQPLRFLRKKKEYAGFNYFYQKRLLEELFHYWNGTGRSQGLHEMYYRDPKGNVNVYGLDVTKLLIDCIPQPPEADAVFDYRVMHMVAENKRQIASRLEFLEKTEELSNQAQKYIAHYRDLANRFHLMQNFYIKASLLENKGKDFYQVPKKPASVHHLCSKLTALWEEEKLLWQNLFPRLLQDLFLQSSETRSPNLALQATMRCFWEQDQYVVEWRWEKAVYVGQLRLCTFLGNANGIFYLSTGERLHCDEKKDICYIDLLLQPRKVEWIRFYPDTVLLGKKAHPYLLYAAECNMLIHAKISATSTYQNEQDPSGYIPQPEEIASLEDYRFWSPMIEDPEPCLLFEFPKPIRPGQIALRQGFYTRRIVEFVVEYTEAEEWKELCQCTLPERKSPEERNKTERFILPGIETTRIRLRFTKRQKDELGFDIPNINYLGLYETQEDLLG